MKALPKQILSGFAALLICTSGYAQTTPACCESSRPDTEVEATDRAHPVAGAFSAAVASDTDPEVLYRRAADHETWMREHLMPAGGVMSGQFTDDTYAQVKSYGGERDPAIWTGSYLAAQALRLEATGAADAADQLAETVRVLHRWWRISGDAGYLARFAAPADSSEAILATLPAGDPEVIRDVPYEDALWHWRGRVSRDQYQGVLLGMSLAYEATSDPGIRQLIREDVATFAEQLMRRERKRVKVIINGSSNFSTTLELQHAVYTDDETPDGIPILNVRTSPFEVEASGMVVFWPNPSEFIRQIPGLGWLPDVLLPSQAIQLAAAFRVALQVTAGVPGYEARHAALSAHYDEQVDDWLDIATGWENTNECGDAYYGLNVAFMPMYNWVRLEDDPVRRARLQRDVLRDALWSAVEDHKNVFFAFLYAAQAAPEDAVEAIIEAHLAQLALFPNPPQTAEPIDVRSEYPEDPECPGLSAIATDVDDRPGATFLWERQPWKLLDPGAPEFAFAGVDYLLAYWLGRQSGFIDGNGRLGVSQTGTGGGTITSSPPGIDCGSSCEADFALGSEVLLQAFPAPGSVLIGWSGDPSCPYIHPLEGATDCVATFASLPSGETRIEAAVLPYARAVGIGETATAFASLINSGDATATGCSIALPGGLPATFTYQTTDSGNALIGMPDTPVDIPRGGTQGFVFGITPSQALAATEIAPVFDCTNTAPAFSHAGLNTFILSAAATAPPDLLAVGVTPSGDGVVRLPSRDGTGFFATAAVNIGSAGTVRVGVDDGGRALALALRVCETDAAGTWLVCGDSLSRTIGADQTVYYTVLASGNGQPIAFDPAINRLFLRFEANGTTVGATNVAVATP
ncbi:hypothetical protein [Thiocapsa marina]|uniref:Uncharacterized protein n=1 Tax=Thiocapsa marina 5811 TaxID=768671 RepID=F9U721_9GAMM|nr:hypothetical protein [Thiocapsa marina]EGV20047.1 hypothetical protein ThimaDRAFT_0723 [Thiocapsa marina 5811]